MKNDSYQERITRPIYPYTAQERRLLGHAQKSGSMRRLIDRGSPQQRLPFDYYLNQLDQDQEK